MLAAEEASAPVLPVRFPRIRGIFFSISMATANVQKHETRTVLLHEMGCERDIDGVVNTGDAARRSIQQTAVPVPSMTRGLQVSLRFSIHSEIKASSRSIYQGKCGHHPYSMMLFSANTRFEPIVRLAFRLQTKSIDCGLRAVK